MVYKRKNFSRIRGGGMRRIILLGILSFCLPMLAYAASIGGIETQGKGKFAVQVEYENIFDRDLKLAKTNYHPQPANIDKVEIKKLYRSMVKANYGLLDPADVYLKLGVSSFKQRVKDSYGNGHINIYDSQSGLAYAIGVKYIFPWTTYGWLLGVDTQYLRQSNDWKTKADFQGEGDKAYLYEWQIACLLGRKLGNFTPYLGVKYSDLRVKTRWAGVDEGKWEKYKAKDHWGVILGTDYKLSKSWALNFETRFIDETAISFGGTYRF